MNPQSDRVFPIELRTERLEEPLGVDAPQPLFSWQIDATGRDRRQTAYRIRVTDTDDPTDESVEALWDSGIVVSADQIDVPYAGTPLRPRTTYRWAVRIWDELDQDSGWSGPATFETGFLGVQDWGAQWIGASAEVGRPMLAHGLGMRRFPRVWLGTARAVRFRRTVDIPAGARIVGADLYVGGAETIATWVNGSRVESPDSLAGLLHNGANLLAVEAIASPDETPGLVARLQVQLTSGEPVLVTTADAWRASTGAPDGWQLPSFDDSQWKLAVQDGFHADPPRGREPATYRPIPYLRKAIHVRTDVRSARLYATALGLFEFRVNGAAVTRDRMAPGWTDYKIRVPYQVYDVTQLLRGGGNVLAARIADGWYAGSIAWFGPCQYGDRPWLQARLEITYGDGSTETVVTDESWQLGTGGIRYADLVHGEVVDARLEPTGWDQPGYDASGWNAAVAGDLEHGELFAQVAPPVTVQAELPAKSITERPDGRLIVDFGQNLVGGIRLRVRGDAGIHVVVRYAEVLDAEGDLYLEALRGADVTDEFFLSGAHDVFDPRFTQHGFRYAEITGTPPDEITALAYWAEMEQIGEFECSNDDINQLQSNIVWGQRGNFLTVPTDCPQRDERLGWTGDAQAFGATAAFNYDVRTFFDKWLTDLRDCQREDGSVAHFAPDPPSSRRTFDAVGAAGWGDAIAVVPARLAEAYDDRRAAESCLDAIDRWLEFCRGTTTGLIRPDWGFGDWLAIESTPRDLVATAFFAYAARIAADLAHYLEDEERAAAHETLHDEIRAAFRARWLRGGGRLTVSTQAASVLALHIGLLDPDEETGAAEALVANIKSRNWHLATGFLGAPYLLSVLERTGHLDVAYRLLLQDTVPSWLYPVVHGDATTIWERWDSWSDSRGFQDPGMTSFNHYAYGAIGEWIYRTVGGLGPAAPGYRELEVRPQPGGGIEWARTTLRTPYGRASVGWSIDGDRFALDVSVPAGCRARISFPDGVDLTAVTDAGKPVVAADLVVGSGEYSLESPYDRT